MKCVDCDRKLPAVLDKCMYCGGVLESVDSVDDPIDCSLCETTMEKQVLLDVTIDECPSCNSRWFDRGELETLIERKNTAKIPNRERAKTQVDEVARFTLTQTKIDYRGCPRCPEMMLRRNYEQISGVMVDTCPVHGTFLDEGEFNKLRAFVETEGPQRAKQMRDEERRDIRRGWNVWPS